MSSRAIRQDPLGSTRPCPVAASTRRASALSVAAVPGLLLALVACAPSASRAAATLVAMPPLATGVREAPTIDVDDDVALEARAVPPGDLQIDGDVGEWSLSEDRGNRVVAALDATGLVLAGRLAHGVESVTVEVSSRPHRVPPVGFSTHWGVDELSCTTPPPGGRPWEAGECEAHLAARDAFAASYEERFHTTYFVAPSGVTRGSRVDGAATNWRVGNDGMATFEVRLPPGALPEVADAPLTRLDLEAHVNLDGGREGNRSTVTIVPEPAVSFEPYGATRAFLFMVAGARHGTTPMSYQPGGGLEAHAIEHERGHEPRPLVLRDVQLRGPLLQVAGQQIARVYAGTSTVGIFRDGLLIDVLRAGEDLFPLAAGPVERGGAVHLAAWTRVAGARGCPATTVWIVDARTLLHEPSPTRPRVDPPPDSGAPPTCWISRDTWANEDATIFRSAELRHDPSGRGVPARTVTWTYAPQLDRYVRTVEADPSRPRSP